jgi:tetratricopeptide (TPR) repeat protein
MMPDMKRRFLLFFFLFGIASVRLHGQETVFALLTTDEDRADKCFQNKNFVDAQRYYRISLERSKGSNAIYLKLARTNFYLKNYDEAILNFELYSNAERSLSRNDVFLLGEAYTCSGNYSKAIEVFKNYNEKHGDDPLIVKKIWRLSNAQFLFEDSLHYAITPLELNTNAGELSARPYQNGILFLSNRKQVRVIEKLNPSRQPFYTIYYSDVKKDSVVEGKAIHSRIVNTQAGLSMRYNAGPFCLYANQQKLVFATNLENPNKTLGLVFAEAKNGGWQIVGDYNFNNSNYSITDPSISEDGTVLYFCSDMGNGFGGKDLYRSDLRNGEWSKPVNLGETINTPLDESFPFFKDNTLYFSSTGHAGLGGLDIFKSEVLPEGFDEPKNLGYPVNSKFDDFSIYIDSLNTGGYFSSNRLGGGFNDDIFRFEMDLQTYPVEISGRIRFKGDNLNDSSKIETLRNARLFLIDAIRNVTVFEGKSDDSGTFQLTIPYFSKFKIKVVGEEGHENTVSLEIPKHRKDYSAHDIVIVRDLFKTIETR